MDIILLIGFLILVFLGIPVGFGLLLFFIPKKLGYPKTAKYLTIVYGLIMGSLLVYMVFPDLFFTKNEANELVKEQNILLQDRFDLLNNESMFAIGDYYHTFTLKISERDRRNAIKNIKNSDNFKVDPSVKNLFLQQTTDRYFGKKMIQNYETDYDYIREYFEPSGQKGYAPTFRRISISKHNNQLLFEDIVE